MKQRSISAVLVSLSLTACATSSGGSSHLAPSRSAAPAAKPSEPEEEDWRFVIAPYAWLLSVDGHANLGGSEMIVDEDFSDIFDNLNFVAEARFEAWKGKHGLFADLTYTEIESDIEVGPLEGDSKTDITLAFLGYMQRVVAEDYASRPGGVTVDALVGVSVTSMDGDLDFDGGASASGDEDIVDPFFGLRTRFSLTEKWGASLETLIGGFELLDGSDLTTMTSALVGRAVGENGHLYFGWRTLDIDYNNDDDGKDEFGLNVNMNGPVLGYEWSF